MKKLKLLFTGLMLLALVATNVSAAEAVPPAKSTVDPQVKKICETVSLITGVAISPLLGVGVVGAYDCFAAKTDAEKAARPWFANPMFWIPALLLVGVCFVKDAAGTTVIPTVLKKPLDAAEVVEHKISGLVATGAFVPVVASIFHSAAPTSPSASLAAAGFATIDLHWLYNALMVPVAMAAFFIVFLASNAISILILISPFSTVDTALKLFRTAILGTVVGSSAFSTWSGHPWFGAAWALIIILISYLIAGWSFRLSHFGLVFVWDFFTGRKHRFHPDTKQNKMFLGSKCEKVATRTYGRLARNDKGELTFTYRKWLVLPPRTITLPPGNYEAGRGVFYSEILRVEGESAKTAILLPPRYLGHEEELVKIYSLAGARDVGLRAAWAWFKSLFGGKTAAT